MTSAVFQALSALVAAAGGLSGLMAILRIGPIRRSINAQAFRAGVESEQVLSKTRIDSQNALMHEIEFLSKRLKEYQSEIAALRAEIQELRAGLVT